MKNYKALVVFIVCNVIIAVIWGGSWLFLFFNPPEPGGFGDPLLAIWLIIMSCILHAVSLVYLGKFIDSLK